MLFHAATDPFLTYPLYTRCIQYDYIFSPEGGGLILHIDAKKNKEGEGFGLQVPIPQKSFGKATNFKDLVPLWFSTNQITSIDLKKLDKLQLF